MTKGQVDSVRNVWNWGTDTRIICGHKKVVNIGRCGQIG